MRPFDFSRRTAKLEHVRIVQIGTQLFTDMSFSWGGEVYGSRVYGAPGPGELAQFMRGFEQRRKVRPIGS